MVHRRGSPLVVVGGRAGRHGELILGNTQVVSVDGSFTRRRVGFSDQARQSVGGGVDTVHQGVGQACHRVGVSMPCRFQCGAWPGDVQVHGNAPHALRVLGDTVASARRDRGGVLSGSGVAAPRGIGSTRAEELYGKVTRRGVVGGLLAELGCPRSALATPSAQEGQRWWSLRRGVGVGFQRGGAC
jgi:hypothetical protein